MKRLLARIGADGVLDGLKLIRSECGNVETVVDRECLRFRCDEPTK